MRTTPKSLRPHIALLGRRNVGKSSLLNALTGQAISLVSPIAGTTTDPVEKSMEVHPLGPVVWIDTAGLDDDGELGKLRVDRTRLASRRADLALLVSLAGEWTAFEDALLATLREQKTATIVVLNQCDAQAPTAELRARLSASGFPVVETSAVTRQGLEALLQVIVDHLPADLHNPPPILGDLVPPGETAVLVMPIDSEAPAGRIILPQVQAVRDLLDHHAMSMVVQPQELPRALEMLRRPPAVVVTDSQAFEQVSAMTPADVPLTSFSILFARLKGDLDAFIAGARAVDRLRPHDKVLISEACTHNPNHEDIGRVKIPRWLDAHVGGPLEYTICPGRELPQDLASFALVVHCGACVWNRREVMARVHRCQSVEVPVTNYGVLIARMHGVLDRALSVFRARPTATTRGHGRPAAPARVEERP